jgi:hypothetical protein
LEFIILEKQENLSTLLSHLFLDLDCINSTLAVVTGIILWTKYLYGRDAKKLENILNEMEEE